MRTIDVIQGTRRLTKTSILSLFDVDAVNGRCYWKKVSHYHSRLNGKEAGTLGSTHSSERWVIKVNGVAYKRAKIIFAAVHGEWPEIIDHIDRNPLNDAISNLRAATFTENAWNHSERRKASLLPRGVRRTRQGNYQARITCNNSKINLGCFRTVDEAATVYQQKRREMFGAYCGL